MKTTLARLVSNFEFTLEQPADSVTYTSTLTLPIKGESPCGLCIGTVQVQVRHSFVLCSYELCSYINVGTVVNCAVGGLLVSAKSLL